MMKSQAKREEMAALLRARNPLLWVVSKEETRVKKNTFEAAASAFYEFHAWDIKAGVTGLDGQADLKFDGTAGDPDALLDMIRSQKGTEDVPNRGVWVLCDMSPWITPPVGAVTQRALRNLVQWLPSQPGYSAQAIVVISSTSEVPTELADDATVIEWPLPDREEIAACLDATVASLPEKYQATAVNGARDAVIDAAVGLSWNEAQATFSKSLVSTKTPTVDPAAVAAEKERAVRSSGLEFMKPLPGGMKAVGGLDNWKQWALSRAVARTPAAREYGLQAPRGALLLGVPGCGKTLSAKALASEWKVPLIKFDINATKGKYVGESEAGIRRMLARAEAIGPCILLWDEIEKALAGSTGAAGDGGVSADALGVLLTWMQDHDGEAFVIATANNIDNLPPELLRKGRFDEVWWIGLPNEEERAGVIAAALRSHGRDAEKIGIDLVKIAKATDQFSGAEIAALVPEAMFAAFAEDAREITTSDILTVAKSVQPKGTDKKRPEFAREATSTSTKVKATANGSGRVLDI